jgi:hypothetical protein
MDKSSPMMAQQIGRAASAFERQRTGHVPKSVSVVLGGDTLMAIQWVAVAFPRAGRPRRSLPAWGEQPSPEGSVWSAVLQTWFPEGFDHVTDLVASGDVPAAERLPTCYVAEEAAPALPARAWKCLKTA